MLLIESAVTWWLTSYYFMAFMFLEIASESTGVPKTIRLSHHLNHLIDKKKQVIC
jgi:hypothetical protein